MRFGSIHETLGWFTQNFLDIEEDALD